MLTNLFRHALKKVNIIKGTNILDLIKYTILKNQIHALKCTSGTVNQIADSDKTVTVTVNAMCNG